MRLIVLATIACVVSMPVATRSQVTSHPAPEDINLYYGAFRFVLAVHTQSLSATSAQETLTIQNSVCKELGITRADYEILVNESLSLSDTADAMSHASGKGWEARSSTASQSPAQSAATTAEKLVKAGDIVRRLKQGLSPDGWAHFHTFVNGKFRAATSVTRTGK